MLTCLVKGSFKNINLIPGNYKFKLYIDSSIYTDNTPVLNQFRVRDFNVNNIIPYSPMVSGMVKFDYQVNELLFT
jgi:hypothetical protein